MSTDQIIGIVMVSAIAVAATFAWRWHRLAPERLLQALVNHLAVNGRTSVDRAMVLVNQDDTDKTLLLGRDRGLIEIVSVPGRGLDPIDKHVQLTDAGKAQMGVDDE